MRPRLIFSALVFALTCGGAHAAEITLIAPGGIKAAFDQLIPDFERSTGHKVVATYGSGGGTKDRVVRGDPFDVPIVQPPFDNVLASGNVIASSETPLAGVAVGLAVRTGASKPDISTADALKRVLLAARAISYPDPATGAAAGVSLTATLQKLGIAAAMQPKTIMAQGGANAMARLAKGEVDIGLTFISEMLAEPGIELVGPLPREISPPTMLVGFVSSHAKPPEAAEALLRRTYGRALPQTAEVLFEDVSRRISGVREVGPALLVRCAEPYIAQMISHDKTLGKLCLLAGEDHLVVPQGSIAAFRRGLKRLGYLLSAGARG